VISGDPQDQVFSSALRVGGALTAVPAGILRGGATPFHSEMALPGSGSVSFVHSTRARGIEGFEAE
jgi:hypothetical protein